MAELEDQETQVYFSHAFPSDSELPSSPGSGASLHIQPPRNRNDDYDAHVSEEDVAEVVEETQFDGLEPDTQAYNDSFVLPETQFDGLEKDTQAVDEAVTFAAPSTTDSSSQLEIVSLIKRPELPDINDAQDGFKFAPAQPRKQNASKRPLTKPIATDMRGSVPEPSPDFNRHAHAHGTQPRITDSAHRPNSTTPFPDVPQPSQNTTIATSVIETQSRSTVNNAGLNKLAAEQSAFQSKHRQASTEPMEPSDPAASARPLQRKLSRGRQRIKQTTQPFPEETSRGRSRRWGSKLENSTDGVVVQQHAQNLRSGTPSNTGRARLPARDDETSETSNGNSHSSFPRNDRRGEIALPNHSSTTMRSEDGIGVEEHTKAAKLAVSTPEAVKSLENSTSASGTTNRTQFSDISSNGEQIGYASSANGNQNSSIAADTARREEHNMHCSDGEEPHTEPFAQLEGHLGQVDSRTAEPTSIQDTLQDVAAAVLTRPPSRPVLDGQSRPPSRRANRPKNVTRPLSERDLAPAAPIGPHSNPAKVKKPSTSNKKNMAPDRTASPEPQDLTGFISLVQLHQQSAHGILQVLKERDDTIRSKQAKVEEQQAYIMAQEAEIKQQASKIEAQKLEIQSVRQEMEKEMKALAPKYSKIMQQGQKYAKHANDVVAAQKWLKDAADSIKKRSDEIKQGAEEAKKRTEEALEALATSKQKTANLQDALNTSKEVRLMAQTLETVRNEKNELTKINNRLLAEEKSSKGKLEALEKQFQELYAKHTAQSNEKAGLETEVEKLRVDTKDAIKNNTLLQKSIDDRLIDLATEKHNNEQLQKNLSVQTATWSKLLEAVKQIPADTVEVLNGNDGTLARLLTSESTTQEKVEELTSVIKEFVKREPDLPPTIVKLVQDVALRLEGEKQLPERNDTSLKDAAISIAQELKENLDQLRLDKETEIRLNSKITELEHAREGLSTLKIARDTEVETLSRQLEESRRELLECRSDLSSKNNELAAALNAPREDHTLRSKLSELQQAKVVLEQQVKDMSQEISKVKEDLSTARKIASSKEEESRALTDKLNNAQQTIRNFNETKVQALAQRDEAHKKACQEIAKNMESQKATIKLKLESEVKTYELRVKEKTEEIKKLNEQLQNLQESTQNDDSSTQTLAYTEQMMKLVAEWHHLQQNSGDLQDNSKVLGELKSHQDEITGLKLVFQKAVTDSAQAIQIASDEQRYIVESLRSFDAVQKKGMREAEPESSPCKGVPRTQSIAHLAVSPVHLRSTSNLTETEDDMLLDNIMDTPEHALRNAIRNVSSVHGISPLAGKQATARAGPVLGSVSSKRVVFRQFPERHPHSHSSQHPLSQQMGFSGHHVSPGGNNWGAASSRHINIHTQPSLSNMDGSRGPTNLNPAGYELATTELDHISTSGPFSNPIALNQIISGLGANVLNEHSEKRSKNVDNFLPDELAIEHRFHPGDDEVGRRPTRPVRSQKNALTVAEESRSRRTSQPSKSVLKKSTRDNTSSSELTVATAAGYGAARLTRSNSNKSLRPSPANTSLLDNIKGAVSGRGASSRNPSTLQRNNSLDKDTANASHFFGGPQSPLVEAPTKNRHKRAAETNLESSRPKARRRLFPSQTTIPDSQ